MIQLKKNEYIIYLNKYIIIFIIILLTWNNLLLKFSYNRLSDD